MPCSSIALKMLTFSIRSSEIRCKPAVPLGQGWWDVEGRMRGWRVQQGGQMPTECFGGLTDKDEAVVKGLAASLACSSELGQSRL
jgi:hypothetical protein